MLCFEEELKRDAPVSAPKPAVVRESVSAAQPATAPIRGFALSRVVVLALALMLALAFAGCGSDDAADAGSGSAGSGDAASSNANGGGESDVASGDTGGVNPDDTAGGDTGSGGANASSGGEAPPAGETAAAADATAIDSGGALTFDASEITEQASFFPLTVDGTYMEVIAVRAPDDTVRTAFNTCQVCWDSGRGYYIQESDELVCQNCGNRFNVSDVEVVHGGCNPVPITEEYKTADGDSVAIGYDLLKEAVPLFADWKS